MYTNFKDDINDNFYYDGIIGRKSINAVSAVVVSVILLYECYITIYMIIHYIILYKAFYS